MNTENPAEWWMWQMYRRIAEIIHQPSLATEERLRALIAEYRQQWEQRQTGERVDPHERAMDYM